MASKRRDTTDPYAPPPMYHDRSGAVVRVGLIALLAAAVGAGYFAWSATSPASRTATVAPIQEQRQLADAGYRAQPEQIPQVQPVAPAPPQAAPERRRTAPRRSRSEVPPEESAPPPVSDVPTTPAPIPPTTTTPQLPDAAPPTQG
jgi:hypothetical protein